MSAFIVIGGGVAGLSGAMLLARDGHHVTVLEQDPSPPPEPQEAWETWDRRGVTQFRLPHLFLPRFRELLDSELPDVATGLEAAGALRFNRMVALPKQVTGGFRPGDERFEQLTGRRPVIEAALAQLAAAEPGVEIRRGVTVRGLLADWPTRGAPHVTGVVTDDGEHRTADLVIDAGGRRSALPELLAAIGAPIPVEEQADSGFVYYGRHFRSTDGTQPHMMGPPLQHYVSVTLLTLPADSGYWSVAVGTSAKDKALRRAQDVEVWERIVRSYPLVAHWIDAEPVTGIDVMARIVDRVRRYDPATSATGVVAIGDAAACTNPSIGRGASTALLYAVCLRDVVRDVGTAQRRQLLEGWSVVAGERVEPYVNDTLTVDRHRRAQIEAEIAGESYETSDPGWSLGRRLMAAGPHDPEILRGAMDVAGMLARGADVLRRPGLMDAIERVGPVPPLPGPSREELMDVVGRPAMELA